MSYSPNRVASFRGLALALLLTPFAAWAGEGVSAPAGFDPARAITRIAFGSCAEQNKPQPIWDAVLAAQPQLFLFLGDNVYGDTRERAVLEQA